MSQSEPGDITNHMILEALHGVKSDLRDVKQDVALLKQEFSAMKQDVSTLKHDVAGIKIEMGNMEYRLEKKIVEESDRLARAMMPSNKQLASEIKKVKKYVGMAA